jgi:hypothetical protein
LTTVQKRDNSVKAITIPGAVPEDETRKLYMQKIERRVTSHNNSSEGADRPDLMDQLRAYYDHQTEGQDTSNNAFYTNKAILERESLRYHPKILALLDELWLVTDSDGDGQVDRNEYVSMSMKLYRCFVGDGDRDNAADIAQTEWQNDSFGCEFMDKAKFKQAWFQLADTWTATTDPSEYVIFLQGILQCLTVKKAGKRRWRSDSMIQSFDDFHVEDDRRRPPRSIPEGSAWGTIEEEEEEEEEEGGEGAAGVGGAAARKRRAQSPQQLNEEHQTGDYHARSKPGFMPTAGKEPNWSSREKGPPGETKEGEKKKTFALSKEREEQRRLSLHARVPHMRRRLTHVPPEALVEMLQSNLLDPPHVYFSEDGLVLEHDRLEQVLEKLQKVPPAHLFPGSFSPAATVGGGSGAFIATPVAKVEQERAGGGKQPEGGEELEVASQQSQQQDRRMTRKLPLPWHTERERVRQTMLLQQSAGVGGDKVVPGNRPNSAEMARTWPGSMEMVSFQESDDEEDDDEDEGGVEGSTVNLDESTASTVKAATFDNSGSARGILPGLQAMREKLQQEQQEQQRQWEVEVEAEAAEELEELLAEEQPVANMTVGKTVAFSASAPTTPTAGGAAVGFGGASSAAGTICVSFPMALWSVRDEEYNQTATWVAADCSDEATKKKQSNTRTRQAAVLRKRAHQKKLRAEYGSFQRQLSPMSGACPRPTRAYAPRTFVKSINAIRAEYEVLSKKATFKHSTKMGEMGGSMSMISSFSPASEAFAQPLRRPASTPGAQRSKISISEGVSFESTVTEGKSAGQRPVSAGTDFNLLRRTLGATGGSSGVIDVLGKSPAIITKTIVNIKRGGAV